MTVEHARWPSRATTRRTSLWRNARRTALSVALVAVTWPAIAQAEDRIADLAIHSSRITQAEGTARATDRAGTRGLPWAMACACVAAAMAARGFATANARSRQPAARKA